MNALSNLPPGAADYDVEEAAGAFDEESESSSIPCSKCGKPTTWDATYQDLCYRCCRADNE